MKSKDIENLIKDEGLKNIPDIDIERIASTAVLPAKPRRVRKKGFAVAMAVIIAVVCVSTLSGVLFGTVSSEITISVNPALALAVTPMNTVKSVEMLNSDAEELFDEKEIEGKTVEAASEYIVNKLYEAGYITEDSEITVTAKGNNKKQNNAICEKIHGKANRYKHSRSHGGGNGN